MIAIATAPILHFQAADLISAPQGGDFYAVQWPKDQPTVLSVQPDGSFATRPLGTFGAYEVCQKKGNNLVYSSDGHLYVVPLIDGLE